mgnify:CR=1 FL=1
MTELTEIPDVDDAIRIDCDVLVIGGGTAGTMAALTAAENGAQVLLLEKAHVRHSGALAMGMDGVNNAVIPGKAEPEDYVAEITRANDGIVNQRTVYQTATRGFAMVQRLERYGVKFEKDEHGEYAVRRVHRSGSYVLPMPEGKDVKKALYRVLRQRSALLKTAGAALRRGGSDATVPAAAAEVGGLKLLRRCLVGVDSGHARASWLSVCDPTPIR